MNPFTNQRRNSVAALGEEKLIERIQHWLGNSSPPTPFGIGDDCAVLPSAQPPLLVTVDPVIYGRHFDGSVAARSVGEKLLKRNLSDIAAMGGVARAAVIALTLDPRTRITWVESFYRGIAAAARRHGVKIVGGDVAQGDNVVAASLTLIGDTAGRRALTRKGARLGDGIFVTGQLGNTVSSGHHFRFQPRLREGQWLAGRREVRAMMDVSDGLAKDLRALTPPGAVAALWPQSIPCRRGAGLRAAVSDGEDYELLFAVARTSDQAGLARAWRRRFPNLKLTRIGEFVRKNSLPTGAIDLEDFRGYEHLR